MTINIKEMQRTLETSIQLQHEKIKGKLPFSPYSMEKFTS